MHILYNLSEPNSTGSHIRGIKVISSESIEYINVIHEYNDRKILSLRIKNKSERVTGVTNPKFYDELCDDYFLTNPKFNKLYAETIDKKEYTCPYNDFVTIQCRQVKHICLAEVTKDANDRFEILKNNLHRENLSVKQIELVESILFKYNQASYIEFDPIIHTNVVQHVIKLVPNSKPVFTKQYRIPEALKQEVENRISELLSRGIIEP